MIEENKTNCNAEGDADSKVDGSTVTLSHEAMRNLLAGKPGKSFVSRMTRSLYGWAAKVPADYTYRIFNEFTIRYKTRKKTGKGLKKNDDYRMDCVIMIQSGRAALGQEKCFSIGIELKESLEDLKYDNKIVHYLGWTDYFFIGVPYALSHAAAAKVAEIEAEHPEATGCIGVVTLGDYFVIDAGRRQKVSKDNRISMYEQIIYNCVFKDLPSTPFNLKDTSIINAVWRDERQPADGQQHPTPAESQDNTPENTTTNIVLSNNDNTNILSNIDNNENADDNTPVKQQAKGRLSAEKREERHRQYLDNKQRRREQAVDLRQKNKTLTDNVRDQLAALPERDQLVFWAIREAPNGISRPDMIGKIGQSPAGVARSVARLKDSNLVALEGSRKTGVYVPTPSAKKSSRCLSCIHKDECQGDSLRCGDYQSVE